MTGDACDTTHAHSTASSWRRFWARSLDLLLGACMVGVVVGAVRPSLLDTNERLLGFLAIPCAMLLEVIVYACFGNTPGKAVAGIRVVDDRRGERLSPGKYLKRNSDLYLVGIGLGVPIFGLITLVDNYRRRARGELTRWDLSAESQVIAKSASHGRTWITAGVYLLVLIPLLMLGMYPERAAQPLRVESAPQFEATPELALSEQELMANASSINAEARRMVTPDTRFEAVHAGRDLSYTYDYTMTRLRRSELSAQQLDEFQSNVRNRLQATACGETHLAFLLRRGAVLRARYLDTEGSELGTVEVNGADCH